MDHEATNDPAAMFPEDLDWITATKDGGDDSSSTEDDAETIAGYLLESRLGKGAFANVFVGRHERTWETVALKQILKVPNFATGHTHEYVMTKRFNHPHIVSALDCVEQKSERYIVFEFCNGGDLYDELGQEDCRLSRNTIRRYLHEAATALAHMHSKNMVHCDVKLENMLIHNNSIKLCDFGIAGQDNEGRCGCPYGTSAYMAPELIKVRSRSAAYSVTKAQDVWSFGVVMYAVLFNDLPWEKASENDADYADMLHQGGIQRGLPQQEVLSVQMRKFMCGMLAVDPAERITMQEVADFLGGESRAAPWLASDTAEDVCAGPSFEDWAQQDAASGEEDEGLSSATWANFRTANKAGPAHLTRTNHVRRSSSLSGLGSMRNLVDVDFTASCTSGLPGAAPIREGVDLTASCSADMLSALSIRQAKYAGSTDLSGGGQGANVRSRASDRRRSVQMLARVQEGKLCKNSSL